MTHTPETTNATRKTVIVPPTPKPQAPVEPLVVEKGKCGARIAANRRKQNVLLTVAGSLVTMLG